MVGVIIYTIRWMQQHNTIYREEQQYNYSNIVHTVVLIHLHTPVKFVHNWPFSWKIRLIMQKTSLLFRDSGRKKPFIITQLCVPFFSHNDNWNHPNSPEQMSTYPWMFGLITSTQVDTNMPQAKQRICQRKNWSHKSGKGCKKISRALKMSISSVQDIITKWKMMGSAENRPTKVSATRKPGPG